MSAEIDLTATPRYRITGDLWRGVNGIAKPPGTEFESIGWPPDNGVWVEGVNEPARRIIAYLGRMGQIDPCRPDMPFNPDIGMVFLPDCGFGKRATNRIVPEDQVLPGMPKWRALVDFPDDQFAEHRRFPFRDIRAGDVICVLDWPDRLYESEFAPENAEAELVRDYFVQARGHPKILVSPWCWYHASIVLPELPATTVNKTDYPRIPAMAVPEKVAA